MVPAAGERWPPQANTMSKKQQTYVDVEYDGPIDDTGKKHIGPFIASGAGGVKVLFMPGANRIKGSDWIAIRDTQGVKWRIDEGHFRVLSDGTKGHDIACETQRRALELIRTTIEPDILEGWLVQENGRTKSRKSVLEAIEAQLGHVEVDPAKRGKPELRNHRIPEGVEPIPEE